MAGSKTYALLCPIARALDAVGDRWTLLILRDLHAGPARFSDLRAGLPGLAPNLLSARLTELAERGLIVRESAERGARYVLTEAGRATRPLLFDLARFGAHLAPPDAPVSPGNRRHVAVTLAAAAEAAAPRYQSLRAEIVLDGEPFSFVATNGRVTMQAGAMLEPPLRYTTTYESLGPVVAGQRSFAEHLKQDATLEAFDGTDTGPFLRLIEAALVEIGGQG